MANPPLKLRWTFFCGLALLALAVRLPRLGERPMHTDEAVNASITGRLLGGEAYQYDPRDRHGPLLYLLAAPLARAGGAKDFSELTENILRLGPAIVGAATVFLFAAAAAQTGFPAALIAALLFAIGPLPVYYSRYFIHETLFVAATLGFLICGWRVLASPSVKLGILTGLCAGLMLACKETALLHFAAAGMAGLWGAYSTRAARAGSSRRSFAVSGAAALVIFFITIITLYTWGGRHGRGPLDLFHSLPQFISRAAGQGHEKPAGYYLALLGVGWSGVPVLALALLGCAGIGWRMIGVFGLGSAGRSEGSGRASDLGALELATASPDETVVSLEVLLVYTIAIGILYSAIPYKTPWLALNLWLPFSVLAGCGSALLWRTARSTVARVLLGLAAAALVVVLGRDTWQRAFADPSGEHNPYAYAHTVEDMLRLPERMNQLAQSPSGKTPLRIAVVASDPWPLPWYLRTFREVGFWQPGQDPGPADVYITSPEAAPLLASRLANRRPEYFGMRPETLILLWPAPANELHHE